MAICAGFRFPYFAAPRLPHAMQINSGNSGGPAFNEAGECVGIAFQSLKVRCSRMRCGAVRNVKMGRKLVVLTTGGRDGKGR